MTADIPATTRRNYGPVQLGNHADLREWQVERGLAMGLIPGPDLPRGRWSAAVAEDVRARRDDIAVQIGSVPDVGAWRAAQHLAELLGVEVTPEAVEELARGGVFTVVGEFKGHALYDGRQIEAFTDVAALRQAAVDGRLLTTEEVLDRLRIRASDLKHIVRAGLLVEAKWGSGPYDSRNRQSVALYRVADVDALLDHEAIDWAAVRAVAPGGRSPLVALRSAAG